MVTTHDELDEREAIAVAPGAARSQSRAVLLMARMVTDSADDFCIVSNISPEGACIESTLPLTAPDTITLDFGNLLKVSGKVRWTAGQRAGIAFDHAVDLAPLCSRGTDPSALPDTRRGHPRVRRCADLHIQHEGATRAGELHDISPSGFGVELDSVALTPGDRILVELPQIGQRMASVRWTADQRAGAAFDRPLPLWVLDRWLSAEAHKCLHCAIPTCPSPTFKGAGEFNFA